MSLTLLSLVQTAQAELGLFPTASTVVGNTDNIVQQLFALANALGGDLVLARDWTAQQRQGIITTTAPLVTTGDTTAGSATITNLASTTGLTNYQYVATGNGIPSAARMILVDTGLATATLDSVAEETDTGVTITFARDRYPLPSDWSHFIDQTNWDRTNHWPMIGPMSPQEDQWVRSGIVTTGPRRRFRTTAIYAQSSATSYRAVEIWPPPQTSDPVLTLAYEYISGWWVRYLSGGISNYKPTFTVDTDVPVFPDRLMISGLKLRFLSAKGLDTARAEQEYERIKQRVMSEDAGAKTVDLSRHRSSLLLSPANVQDANFPAPA